MTNDDKRQSKPKRCFKKCNKNSKINTPFFFSALTFPTRKSFSLWIEAFWHFFSFFFISMFSSFFAHMFLCQLCIESFWYPNKTELNFTFDNCCLKKFCSWHFKEGRKTMEGQEKGTQLKTKTKTLDLNRTWPGVMINAHSTLLLPSLSLSEFGNLQRKN